MELTARELTVNLDARKDRIAAIVAPTDVETALQEIHERIWKLLPRVPDRKSLENLVDIAAGDIALRRWYTQIRCDPPDREAFRQLLEWRGGHVKAEITKTIHIHLASEDAVEEVLENVIVALWSGRGTFDPDKGWFVPWARAIAKNKARSYRPFDWRVVSIDTDRDRPLDLPSAAQSPEDAATAIERTEDADGPPAACFVEILRLVQEFEPHEAIAFLFNRYLEVKPEQIALSIRESSLPDALAQIEQLVRARHPEIAGIDTLLAPLAARLDSRTERFGQFFSGEENVESEIGRWAAKVHRSVRGTILQMGKRFLKLVCDLSAAAHEITCFLWIRLLDRPPVALRHQADRELAGLLETFHVSYSQRALLSMNQVEWCTSDLRKRIRHGRSLNDFAGADLYGSIKRWCNHVGLLMEAPAAAGHMLGYAYITGSLTKGKSR